MTADVIHDPRTEWCACEPRGDVAGFCADCLKTGRPCPDHARHQPDPDEWTVEGVVRCPSDCGLYFDFGGTPQDLHTFISEHDCAFAQTGENYR